MKYPPALLPALATAALIAAMLALSQPATATASVCPLTGQLSQKPALPLHRCLAAATDSCCTTCTDFGTALTVLSVNGSYVIGILAPSLAGLPIAAEFSSLTLCSLFGGDNQCFALIEALYCGLLCNPDASRYLTVTGTTGTIALCNGFINELYAACSNVTIPLIQTSVATLFPTAASLARQLVVPVAQSVVPLVSLNVTITPDASGNASCFGIPPASAIPATPLCCDELTDTPAQCLAEQHVTQLAAQIGRNISSAVCPSIAREAASTALGPLASSPIAAPTAAPGSTTAAPPSPSIAPSPTPSTSPAPPPTNPPPPTETSGYPAPPYTNPPPPSKEGANSPSPPPPPLMPSNPPPPPSGAARGEVVWQRLLLLLGVAAGALALAC